MNCWVIYSTCSIVALCSMGDIAPPTSAADLTAPAPAAGPADPPDEPAGTAIDAMRRSTPA
ncbi:MAG TPA: hypothetical protein VJ971_18255 [Methylomirabilota bacterium]|jgi:hypothetical protein|nr:hypothetical protein [Methylomirabilota bacterium]